MKSKIIAYHRKYLWAAFAILSCIGFFAYGCSSFKNKPESVSILATAPMNHTLLSSYLTIETIFKSDQEILLVAVWGDVDQSEGHTIAWDILNKKGDRVFSLSKENFTIHPQMSVFFPVPVKTIESPGVSSDQLTLHFYIDEKLAAMKNFNYENKEIVRKDVQRIVILPFIEYCNDPGPWPESTKNLFQNTIADAINCEVARIFPDVVPHFIAAQKIGKTLGMGCYNKKECLNYVKEKFGDSFLVFGELYIQRFDLDASSLTVHVYDPRTSQIRKFHFFEDFNYTYTSLIYDLLKGVLYKEGLIDYLAGR
jgi:hypothetical protein